ACTACCWAGLRLLSRFPDIARPLRYGSASLTLLGRVRGGEATPNPTHGEMWSGYRSLHISLTRKLGRYKVKPSLIRTNVSIAPAIIARLLGGRFGLGRLLRSGGAALERLVLALQLGHALLQFAVARLEIAAL